MSKQIIRKACSCLLAAALVLTAALPPGSASHAATTPKDVKGHWAQKYIEKAIDAGIVSGYKDGNFKPESPVSRAEFSHMINQALGNTATASVNFKDVSSGDWFYSDVTKAVAAGYLSGYSDKTFRPDKNITRQEAAVMLSMVVPTYGTGATLTKYSDYSQIASWAKSAMERMVGKGYFNATNNRLNPTQKMTRAQAATVIVGLLDKETIMKSQASLNANGAQLSNTIYSNGISISKSSGSSTAELNKCVVLGTLSVTDGNTVTLTNSRVSQATVQNSSGTTLLAKGETCVKNASVANTATLQTSSLTGDSTYGPGFVNVSIVKNAQVLLNGSFPAVSLDGSSSNVTLASGKINSLSIPSGGANSVFTADSGTTVDLATAAAAVAFRGTGTITKLAANASGITYEKKPGTITLGSGVKTPSQTTAKTTITPDPSNGRTGVNTDGKITLTFNSAMKLYSGSSIASSNIEDFVELRRASAAGTKIDFSASINSGKTVITIEPDNYLNDDTRYYISIAKNKLKDSEGTGNEAFTSYFTTGSGSGSSVSDYLIFNPKNGAKSVYTDVSPQIRFTEDMLCYDGSSVKSKDLEDIIIFREKSSSGRKVSFEATISSDKRTVTIEPEDDLDEDTKYYLAIDSKSLKTASKGTAVPAASVTWTTSDGSSSGGDSDYVTFTPKDGRKNVAVDTEPEIRFSERMECYDGSTLSSGDLEDIIIFREKNSSGDDVKFSAKIDSGKRVVTITPKNDLDDNTKYYLAIDSKSIRTVADGTRVPGVSVTWTTGDGDSDDDDNDYVTFNPKDGKSSVSRDINPTITFSEKVEYYDGTSIGSGRSRDLERCITFEDDDGDKVDFEASYNTTSRKITIEPEDRLDSRTEYTISLDRRSFRTHSDEETIPACSVTWETGSSTGSSSDDDDDDYKDYLSFSPRDGKSNVDRDIYPAINFEKSIKFYDGSSITDGRDRDIEDCITFEDEDGHEVDFKAYYSAARYEITLEPEDRLDSGTEYTITISSRSFRVKSNDDIIPKCSVTWETK